MTITLNAADLHHALSTVLPWASTDKLLPLFRAVHIQVVAGGTLYVEATDRFTAARVTIDAPTVTAEHAGFEAAVSVEDVKAWLTNLKGERGHVELSTTCVTTTLAGDGWERSAVTVQGDWPQVLDRILTPADTNPAGAGALLLNSKFVGRLAKVRDRSGKAGVALEVALAAPGKPVVFTCEDWLSVSIMQMRAPA